MAALTLSPAEMSDILALPAATAPPGQTSNFIDPPSDLKVAIATLLICFTFAFTAVIIRLYTKVFLMRGLLLEDYAISLGFLMFLGVETSAAFALKYGNGRDEWNVRLSDFSYGLYLNNIVMMFYCWSNLFVKISILLQYLRIFVPSSKQGRATYLAIWGTMIAIVVYYIITFGFLVGLCNPREKIWNIFISYGSCYNVFAILEASGILNIISDVVIFVLPLGCVWKLQMSTRKKIAVSGVFAFGSLAIVTSIIRCYYSFELATSNNATYVISLVGIWATGECSISVIVSCMPVMPRFYETMQPRVRSLLSAKVKSFGSASQSDGSYRLSNFRKGSNQPRSAGSRRMGLSDPWNDTLCAPEKPGPNGGSFQIDRDTSNLMHDERGLQSQATVESTESMQQPAPARLPNGREDLEQGLGGGGGRSGGGRELLARGPVRTEIWQTTSIEYQVETQQPG